MKFLQYFLLVAVVGTLLPQRTEAQVANNNPTGPAGDYNGIVTTAGSYDPFTGSASREICDIAVTGAVGAYPLKWTRRMNTRAITRPNTFGAGGGWSHSYQWELEINHPSPIPSPEPSPHDERPDGVLKYPDGRSVDLDAPWFHAIIPAAPEGPFGAMDRFQNGDNGEYDLLMADGGGVKFQKLVQDPQHPHCEVRAIVDPYGITTTFGYANGRLETITEQGAHPRYLQIHYGSHPWEISPGVTAQVTLIDRVEAHDGLGHVTQSVDYVYRPRTFDNQTLLYLTGVNYNGGDTATYEYQASNRLPRNQFDLEGSVAGVISTCDDDRYAGPMRRIKYALRTRNSYYGAAYGEIWKEQNAFGDDLSRLEIPHPGIPGHPYARQEYRENAVRTFYFDNSVWLSDRSDFSDPPHWSHFNITPAGDYDNECHLTDARTYTTDKLRKTDFQITTRITYPQTPFDVEPPYVEMIPDDWQHPHYIHLYRDERHKETEYLRYPNHMVQ
jgi:hypothetical protein